MKSLYNYIIERLGKGWKEESDHNFKATILAFDKPSEEYGIYGGKISKLEIRDKKSNNIVCNYDRGWDIEPKDPKVKEFYSKLIEKYN